METNRQRKRQVARKLRLRDAARVARWRRHGRDAAAARPYVAHAEHHDRPGYARCGRKIIRSAKAHRVAKPAESVMCNRCQGGHRMGPRSAR